MQNQTIMQYFEWYLPSDGTLWNRCAAQAEALQKAGVTHLWLPPAYKGANGKTDVGYAVYDTYDLGEFDQKSSVRTKYGTRDEYLRAVQALQGHGIQVLADVVLNHRLGADACEQVTATQDASENRNQEICGENTISAWTRFTFPGRKGTYSDFTWNWTHFDGTDWNESNKCKSVYQFAGKHWDNEVDSENGNYDYLMGADLDMSNPEVTAELNRWGKWYLDTVGMDGFRLDAVKHIRFSFFSEWLGELRRASGKALFSVGEYWSPEVQRLLHYLDVCGNCMHLFDVPLHFNFFAASHGNGQYDMRRLLDNTLLQARSGSAVTFVDNHDTQPGQALQSFVDPWFKPIAYAAILLRREGIPCVFYGDYYGIPHDHISPVAALPALLYIRAHHAYGEQHDYFDHESVVGFTREGDGEHPHSGIAALFSDGCGGTKCMYVGKQHAGKTMRDALGYVETPVTVGPDGCAVFSTAGGSVSVWMFEEAVRELEVLLP